MPAANVVARPERLSWEEAAAFPLTFLTAYRMLTTRARLQPGETLLVVGAGAGVAGGRGEAAGFGTAAGADVSSAATPATPSDTASRTPRAISLNMRRMADSLPRALRPAQR